MKNLTSASYNTKTNEWNISSEWDKMTFDPKDIFEAWLNNHHISNTAYPLLPREISPYRIKKWDINSVIKKFWEGVDKLWLYVHIPFCEKRCKFCEYSVVDPETFESSEDKYFELLEKEFELYSKLINTKTKDLIWFDIWWWTPSIAKTENIKKVINLIKKYFKSLSWDISIETTPKIAAKQSWKLVDYKEMGIDRISMWVQSINTKLLENVWRISTSMSWNIDAANNIRKAWFEKFNIDMMYWFAWEWEESVKATVKHIIDLDPDYVTLYRMRYKWTTIENDSEKVSLEQVNNHSKIIKLLLNEKWYHANPWKNTFSKIKWDTWVSDYLSQRVATATPYLWLWQWSQSFSTETLSYNHWAASKSMKKYENSINNGDIPIQDLYHLSIEAAMWKMISVSFYFGEINLLAFEDTFWNKLEHYFPKEIDFVIKNDLMEYEDNKLKLTKKWALNYNWVIALFYAWETKRNIVENVI